MASAYETKGDTRFCRYPGCIKTYAKSTSTTKLQKHTATHRNQSSIEQSVASNVNLTLNKQLASIIARLNIAPSIVDRPEFRTELFDLIRKSTRPCPYRHTVANHTLRVAAEYRERIVKRLNEWGDPVTIAMDGTMTHAFMIFSVASCLLSTTVSL